MAKKTEIIVTQTDDFDGGKADRTVAFTVGGTFYEIDLSKKNANAFNNVPAPYVGAARKVRAIRGRAASPASTRTKSRRSDLTQIREWAQANGHVVSDRGRISQTVIDAYDASEH